VVIGEPSTVDHVVDPNETVRCRPPQDFRSMALMAPVTDDVILPSLLISLAFFATFGSEPRIVIRISRAAATITTLTDAARSTSCAGPRKRADQRFRWHQARIPPS
jgi:hypothetical protein